jgi:2-dehydro-3-deoxyphosphogluconate aldolase / (4S)-4-hydroxy-2-oxoglutarate aldolase
MTEPTSLLDIAPVIPVVVVHDAAHAVPIAKALVDGGLPIIELTLRTPVALAAIERIADRVPEILVGAGTIVDTSQAKQALSAGAQFLVSPGSTADLRAAMRDTGLRHLPGAATVSEVLALLEEGYTEMKFFPAEAAGGKTPNVGSVGGSRLTPANAVERSDGGRISSQATVAVELADPTMRKSESQ